MRDYTPDTWVMLKFVHKGETIYKILAGWYGGFANGDRWKLNSGVTEVTEDENYYSFKGSSGSVYHCHKQAYGFSAYTSQVFSSFVKQVEADADTSMEALDEDTKFLELHYE